MSFRTTNYFVFITIHFHDLFSHSLKTSGRGRLHYLLAGDEGLVDCAREALDLRLHEFRGGQNGKKLTKSELPKALQAARVFFIIDKTFKYV